MILNIVEDKPSWERMQVLFEKLTEEEKMFVFGYTQGVCAREEREKRNKNANEKCGA